MSTQARQNLMEAVISFLDEDQWTYQWVRGKPILTMGFAGDAGNWVCTANVKDESRQFLFYSIWPEKAPAEHWSALLEYLTRANYGTILGNFEMDLNDGEVRFKTSIDVEGGELTPTMIKNLIYVNVLTMDRYLPGLLSVMRGEADPAEAIMKIEQKGGPLRQSLN